MKFRCGALSKRRVVCKADAARTDSGFRNSTSMSTVRKLAAAQRLRKKESKRYDDFYELTSETAYAAAVHHTGSRLQ